MPAYLNCLQIFPIKSIQGIKVQQAQVEPSGLRHDRRWMLVDEHNRFLTARTQPKLLKLASQFTSAGLLVHSANRQQPLLIPYSVKNTLPTLQVKIWKDACEAQHLRIDFDHWFSTELGRLCKLASMLQPRVVDPNYGSTGDQVSFADGFPVHLITLASLAELSKNFKTPLSPQAFRANLLLAGDLEPYAEDSWRKIRLGNAEFDVVKPCQRCVLTLKDPETGETRADSEPLKSLRKKSKIPLFGQNLIPRNHAVLKVADQLEILETV